MNAHPPDRVKQMQRRLLKAQRLASERGYLANSPTAVNIYDFIVDTAAWWVFAYRSADDLQDIADSLVRLFIVAETFERVSQR